MANWLLDYIEMTEYIPSELREQLTSIRELDLQVHNAMDELERDIKQFFSQINTLSQQERQDQYDTFLKKCDVATRAASDKVKVADKLHDLVEKSMRLLDQGLEKLKEDLLEGDKAYVVEDLERRSQELDEQLKLEHETMIRGQKKQSQEYRISKSHNKNMSNDSGGTTKSKNNAAKINNSHTNNHRHSFPAHQHYPNHHPHLNQPDAPNQQHRSRNNSTSGVLSNVGRQKKRERKRLNSTMTIFNRNSRPEDDSSSQTFLSSPLTPDYLVGMQNNATTNNIAGINDSSLTIKGMLTGNRNRIDGIQDKTNGNHDHSVQAKQPILTAIDAAHAVSPNATNSDKLVLFSSNPNGDIHKTTHNSSSTSSANAAAGDINCSSASQHQNKPYQQHQQLSNNLLSTASGYSSGDSSFSSNNMAINIKNERHNHLHNDHQTGIYRSSGQFSSLPLSSRHDPIMMAASQAINATQNMTPGRRTSSLKASYAAVNSGRLQNTQQPNQQQLFESQQQEGIVHEVYCKCRSHIHGSTMIACDNSDCRIEWFHYECVGITTAPEGKWYCDECKAALSVQKSHKQPKLEGVNVS